MGAENPRTKRIPIPVLQVDEALNDSDKVLTVPSDTQWEVFWIYVELISTATAGDRQIEIQVRDGANDIIFLQVAGAVQAASLSRHYQFAPGLPAETVFKDSDKITTSLPQVILPDGFDIRIFDNNAVDVAADDMIIQMMVDERSL